MSDDKLVALAEHLSARPMPTDTSDERIRLVADWLDYSLNRCGLVVVPELALSAASERASMEGEIERLRAEVERLTPRYAQPCFDHEYITSGCPACGKLA